MFAVFSNAFMFGIQSGWTAPTLVKLKDSEDFAATNTESSWIASSHEIGRFLGPLLAAILVDKIGRKFTLTMCAFFHSILWTIMVFTRSIHLICWVRMLQGATQSVNGIASCIYVAENCTPKMRGILSGNILIYINVAVIIEYVLATYTSFALAATVNAVFGICGFSTSLFLKETPYYLVMKGYNDKARKNLMWLRGKIVYDNEVESELNKISNNIQQETLNKNSAISVLTMPENYKSLLIIIIFNFLVLMVGSSAITAFSSMILQSSSTFSSREYTIMIGISPLLISVILPFIIERYNRRRLSLCASFSLIVSHVCAFSLILEREHIPEQYFPWFIFVIIATSFIPSNVLIIMAGIISGELPPMRVKAMGNCLGSLMVSLGSFITVAIFLPVTGAYGSEYNFLLYSVSGALLFVFILVILPETRGKSLVDIQKSLQAKVDVTN